METSERKFALKRLGSLVILMFAALVFPGCTMRIETVLQPTTASPHQTITVRLNTIAESGGGGGTRTGLIAALVPNDWTVASSSYYLQPFHLTDTLTDLEVTSTVAEPTAAPDGYQWYIVQTPTPEEPSTGDVFTVVLNMVVGNALGTYDLKYSVGDSNWGWTSSLSQEVLVQPDPCADITAPTDTDGNGYREISNACQLQMMQDNLSADYELTQNIDFHDSANASFLTGKKFTPVGTLSTPFSGHFEGHFHTITGLSIYEPELTGVGLFGYVTGQITDLRLADVEVTGGNRVGTVAGKLSSTSAALVNIGAFGHATGTDMLGGLVGDLFRSTVSSSYSEVNLFSNGQESTGGIAGSMEQGRLANVYSLANINSSAQYVGGLVGHDSATAPSSIMNSYSSGELSGVEYVGGLVGYNNHDDIQHSFSVASPSTRYGSTTVGGLVGGEVLHLSEFLYSKNYWLRGLEAGIGNYEEATSSSKWETVDSADLFKGNSTNAPFRSDEAQVWDTAVWLFAAGEYPQLWALSSFTLSYLAGDGGTLQGSVTQTVSGHADATSVTAIPNTNYRFLRWSDDSTANPRLDTNVTADHTYTALFQRISGGGAAGASSMSPGIGTGGHDAANPGQPIGSTVNVGPIPTTGVNVLTYITNQNTFTSLDSGSSGQANEHQFVISALDLNRALATLDFHSYPVSVTLQKGESRALDLDGDKMPDVVATFSDLVINRVEITLTPSIRTAPSPTNSDKISIPVEKPPSTRFRFRQTLRFGMTSPDVLQLQKWLNTHGFLVATSGLGSPGHETSVFGSATKKSLISFQKKYGLAPYSGVAGIQTLKILNSL